MSQLHRMELRNKETSCRSLEHGLWASQDVDVQSGTDPTAEQGPPGTAIKMGVDINGELRLRCFRDLTAQARISISSGIVRVLELMFVSDGQHGHIPILMTPGCTGSMKNTYGLRMPRSRACFTRSTGSPP